MSEQIVEANAPAAPVIFEIGATVEVELDTGYKPYMDYLATLNGRPPAFGTRNNERKKLALWGKCLVPEGADPQEAAQGLMATLQSLVYQQLAVEGVKVDEPDAAVYVSTKVSTQIGGGGEW